MTLSNWFTALIYRLTSASRDSRNRNKDIRPGDITHEHLSTRFQEYFDTKHRTRLRKLKYTSKEARCDFLSRVLKVEQNIHAHNPGSALFSFICYRLLASIVMTR